jgi:putative protease
VEYNESEVPASLEIENEQGRLALFVQKNKVKLGDGAEIISPGFVGKGLRVDELYSEDGEPIESAPHPFMRFFVRVPFVVREGDIMRSSDR